MDLANVTEMCTHQCTRFSEWNCMNVITKFKCF